MQVQLKPQEQDEYLNKHGGFEGLAKKLGTNFTSGLKSSDTQDLNDRRAQFGRNEIPPKPPKPFYVLMWEALQDTTLIILIICSIISLILSVAFHSEQKLDEEFA